MRIKNPTGAAADTTENGATRVEADALARSSGDRGTLAQHHLARRPCEEVPSAIAIGSQRHRLATR